MIEAEWCAFVVQSCHGALIHDLSCNESHGAFIGRFVSLIHTSTCFFVCCCHTFTLCTSLLSILLFSLRGDVYIMCWCFVFQQVSFHGMNDYDETQSFVHDTCLLIISSISGGH